MNKQFKIFLKENKVINCFN